MCVYKSIVRCAAAIYATLLFKMVNFLFFAFLCTIYVRVKLQTIVVFFFYNLIF